MGFGLGIGIRIRKSAYFDATVAAGVTHFSTYNHMFMPVSYGDQLAEYRRLIEGVAMWDVACQRQVELRGPDASALAQAVVCRDISDVEVGQGKYTPMVDHSGRLINDPLTLRVDEDRWWISLADGDMLYWCRAIAAERGLDVEVSEPDVSPLAVQGPKAEDVIASLFGDWIRDIRYFWYQTNRRDRQGARRGDGVRYRVYRFGQSVSRRGCQRDRRGVLSWTVGWRRYPSVGAAGWQSPAH